MTIRYSTDSDLIQFEIKKYRKNGNDFKIIDTNKLSDEEVLGFVEQTSIFEEEKTKIFINADFLNKKDKKSFVEKLLKLNDNSIFLLDIGEKGKLQDFLIEKAKKIDSFSTKNINELINNILKEHDANFDNDTSLNYFIESVENNPFSIETELNKLINFNKEITKHNIMALVRSKTEESIFNLLNFILLNNYNLALNTLDSLITNKFTIIEIITIISPQLITLKIIKMALEKKMSSYQMQNELSIPY
jgi:DNA polymerase III delta subunit